MRKLCVLCKTRPSTRSGEHVLPKWYYRHLGHGPGPYPWTLNGQPIVDRHGTPIALPDRVRIQLPMCDLCNGILNRRFEEPAKHALRRLFSARGLTQLHPEEIKPVALWFLKTWLLHAHPESTYSHPRIDEHAIKWDPNEVPHGYYDWLINGEPPPAGISLWMFRADEEEPRPPAGYRVALPTVDADGKRIEFVCFQLTFHGLQVTLVVHPGWEIRHPLEAENAVVRLWPNPPTAGVDLARLPALPGNTVSWVRCRVTLKPGVLGSPLLPPLEHASNPFLIPDGVMPFTHGWGV